MSKANKRERQRQNRELAKVERDRLIKRDRRMRTFRSLLFVLIPVAVIFVVIYFINSDEDSKNKKPASGPKMTIDPSKTYTATIATSKGNIDVALDAKKAPVATNNFVVLARKGFYDKLCIDRVATDYVIQGGSPKCDQTGGPGYSVKGEVPKDSYPIGSLAAAKSGQAQKGDFGSQFFIVTGKNGLQLPNDYARFGTVTQGLDVAKAIEALAPAPQAGATNADGPPTEKVTIDKVTITET